MKVRNKLILSFSLIIVILCFINLYTSYNFRNLKNQFNAVNEGIIPHTNLLIEAENIAGDAYLEMMDYVLNENEAAKASAFSLLAYLEGIEAIKQPQGTYISQDEFIRNTDFTSAITQFRLDTLNMITIKEEGDGSTNLLDYGRYTSLASLRSLQDVIGRQKAAYSEELAVARLDFDRAYQSGLHSMMLALGIITVIALIAGCFVTESILKPLYDLRKGTEMIAQGDLSYKVGTKATDEIGQLSRAFDRMTHSLSSTMTSVSNLNQEIAERKQVEKNLQEEKNRANNYLNVSGTMLVALDTHGKVTMINNKGCEILECEKDEIIGKDWFATFIPEPIREEVRDIFSTIISGEIEKLKKIEGQTVQTKNGKIIHITWHNALVKDEHDKITGTLSSGEDVTELRQSEERFRLLADNSTDLISLIRVTPGFKTEYVSPACLQITGYTQEDFYNDENLGLEMMHPDDREAFLAHINSGEEAGDRPVGFRVIHKDGHIVRIEQTHKYIYNSDGELAAMHLIAHDVTERVEAEEALKESEEKYRAVVANINSGIMVIQDGKAVFYNPAVYKMLGYTEREFSKIDSLSTIHPDDVHLAIDRTKERMAGVRSTDSIIMRSLTRSGDIKWLETRSVKITWNNRPAVQAFIIDITDRFNAEEALKESEEKFSSSFHASPSAIAITTLHEGEFIEVNDSFTQVTGYSREEVIGKSRQDINLWANLEERASTLDILEKQGKIRDEEIDFRMKSGELRTWLFSAEVLNIGGKECMITVTNDITDRKKREQLQVAENHVLTLLGKGAELSELLEAIVILGESNDSQIKGSVLLFEPEKEILVPVVGPHIPEEYYSALSQGIPIGPDMGTCGSAAYLRKRVVVSDITDNPLFPQDIVKLAVDNGLLAYWSQPIISSDGELLGTIANYSGMVGEPTEAAIAVLEWSARIAAIAIEQKRAEETLANEAIRRRLLIEQSSDGIVVLEQDGRVCEANQKFCEMLGYSTEEAVNLSVWDWEFQFPREQVVQMIQSVDDAGDHFETRHRRKDGSVYDVEISTNGAMVAGQKLIFCVCRDITERKRMEGELKAHRDHLEELVHERTTELTAVNSQLKDELSERKKIEKELRQAKDEADVANVAKSEFLARMSHEIRTPIHGIMGTLDLAAEGTLGLEQRQYLTMARSSADSLLNVINDILDFSKIEAGKLEIEDVEFHLPSALDETIESMAVSAFRKGLELTCHIDDGIPKALVGDSGRLRQIIINLVGNSIKFTGHGEIAVNVTMEKETKKDVVIRFVVRDTGIGISEEKRDMIFETFQQADGSVSRQYGGTGLGLTICRQLVDRMGGKIWVESTPGQGSSFNFTLKFAKKSKKKQARMLPASVPESRDLPLLLVDDNASVREYLTEVLELWGFRLTSVDNGPAAVQELLRAEKSSDNYRLILLDSNMPAVGGFTVAEKIQQGDGQKPVIIMLLSPDTVSNDIARCQELGIDIHVVKPVRKPVLLEAVMNALGLSLAEQEEIIQVVPSNAGGMCLRILVAEDNPTSQLIARKTLEKMGHTVTIAGNGLEEVRLFEEGEYDLILTDVEMPIMDGFEATRRIKQMQKDKDQNIPIIAMTAYAMKEDRDRCLAAGMDNYLSKPVKPDELHAILNDLFPNRELSTDIPVVTSDSISSNQAVDMNAAMEIFGDDTELLKEASGLFIDEDYPEQLKLLKEGIEQQDAAVVRAAAHSIKGAARTLGGTALGEVAFSLEQMGRDEDLTGAEQQLETMEKEFAQFADFFMAFSP